jgi:hypothetical protein
MIENEIWPSNMKKQVIRPIYKKGNKSDYNNYRPIALLPAINKIIEKFFAQRINNFVNKFNLLCKNQFAYQRGKSTVEALHEINNKITAALNNGEFAGAILVDLQKAFDTVNKDILFEKLYKLGLRGKILSILKSYLTDRKSCVKIDNVYSEWTDVNYGVPQGSVLGPLLFLLYTNDIENLEWRTFFILYADDIIIVSIHYDFKEMVSSLQSDFDLLRNWLSLNELYLSKEKTCHMQITTSHMKNETCQIYTSDTDTLNRVENVKYLGLTIDNHWKFGKHIENLIMKIRQTIPMLYKVRNCLNTKNKKSLFDAWIMSQITYGCSVYGTTTDGYIERLQKIQNKAVKVLFDLKELSASNFMKAHSILNVKQAIDYQIITKNYFNCAFKIPILRNVRSANDYLKIPAWRNSYGKRTQAYRIPSAFNKLPLALRNIDKLGEMKYKMKSWIISNT